MVFVPSDHINQVVFELFPGWQCSVPDNIYSITQIKSVH